MNKARRLKKILTGLLRDLTLKLFVIIVISDFIFSLAGYIRAWPCELASHFRVQYLAVAAVCLVSFFLFRARRWLIAALIVFVMNAAVIVPWYVPQPLFASRPHAHNFRIVLSNVLWKNKNYAAIIELLRQENPDLFILAEVDKLWLEAMKPLRGSYPHLLTVWEHDGMLACFSRYPLKGLRTDGNFQAIIATVDFGGRSVSLAALHPPPPTNGRDFRKRNEQLATATQLARQLPKPLLLIGDLNASLWSPYFADLVSESGLKAAAKGFGVLPTWPNFLAVRDEPKSLNLYPLLRIPIDHCLVSPDIAVTDCRTGPRVGSDHLPLIVDLLIPDGAGRVN
ncbi:MAG: endonuclease/exonuclease/phosphatase family protein [Blastocatellia bacterium]